MSYERKIFEYVRKYPDLFNIAGLFILCFFIFFFNNGSYALMDVDETRYVSMARDMYNTKDFLTLYLNGDYFFEKPPLYFWLECLSFSLFGQINEFSARFPTAFCGALCIFLMYFSGRKAVSRRFGMISAVILASTLEFLMLVKFAILDIVLAFCICASVLSGFLTQFVQEKNVKYFWYLFYIFSGLAVLAKGIPGFIIPFGIMFFVLILNKSFKKAFKPSCIIPGVLLFLLIVLPWHIVMFKLHNPLFFNEYIMKHHIDRFFTSSDVQRKEPFYFYFITILWGMFPYIFSVIAVLCSKLSSYFKDLKTKISDKRYFIEIKSLSNPQKFLLFNVIGFFIVVLFFSASSTKLITYILPVYFFTSFITAYIWEDYIYSSTHKKAINITVYILGGIFITAALLGCFMQFYLPEKIYEHIKIIQWFSIVLAVIFSISSIYFAKKENNKGVFASYVLLMVVLSAFGTKLIYNLDYSFGQNDLMKYAQFCKDNNKQIAIINGNRKYSLLYYYGNNVYYIAIEDEQDTIPNEAKELLNNNVLTIIKNKEVEKMSDKFDFEITQEGIKYKLVKIKSIKFPK